MLRNSRTLLKTGALLLSVAVAPIAAHAASDAYTETMPAESWLSADLVGKSVYAGIDQDSERLGDVNNLIIGADGSVSGVVIGVGGFLGVGEKNVAVNFSELTFATTGEGDERLVLSETKEELEAAPEFKLEDGGVYDVSSYYDSASDSMPDTDQALESVGIQSDNAEMRTVTPDEIETSELVGKRVYTMNDEWIGEVGDIVMTNDGAVDAVVIDFGGFLGVGEKPIAVALDTLTFKSDGDGDGDYYVYTEYTEEQLENAQTYDPETYEANRETMRLGQK